MCRDNSKKSIAGDVAPHQPLRAILSLRERHEVRVFAFALYEVLLGLAIFAIGVIALGRAVGNCVNAGGLSADDARVRQILANRMAEIQTTPGQPDQTKVTKIDTGYGIVRLTQKTRAEPMKEGNNIVQGIVRVSLTADWTRGGTAQKKEIEFYVYRIG